MTTKVLLALVLVGQPACSSAPAPAKKALAEPATPPSEPKGAPQPQHVEHMGTGSALGESIPPPAQHAEDAGPHQDKHPGADASPMPPAVPGDRRK